MQVLASGHFSAQQFFISNKRVAYLSPGIVILVLREVSMKNGRGAIVSLRIEVSEIEVCFG